MLSDTLAIEGDWLVALRQDAGRGRHGRAWETVAGNFLGSTIVQLRGDDPAPPALALAAGLALIEAVEVAAPAIEGRKTASLGGSMTPQAFAPLLAASFARVLAAWRPADPAAFAQAWLARAHPVGTPLDVHSGPGERISGRFDGVETDGAMRLRTQSGAVEIIRAGDVSLG